MATLGTCANMHITVIANVLSRRIRRRQIDLIRWDEKTKENVRLGGHVNTQTPLQNNNMHENMRISVIL